MAKTPVTLILGSDDGAVLKEVDSLCGQWLESKNEWNYVEYDSDNAEIDEILGDIFTPPFLGDLRVVVVKRVTGFSAAALEKLAAGLDDVPESVRVLLTATTIDKRGKFYRQVKDIANLIELDRSGEDLPSQIRKMAAEVGLGNLPGEVVELLANRSGGSLTWVENELAKLSAYLSSSEPLTLEEAERLISVGFEEVSDTAGFELLDLIATGDTAGSLQLLQQMLQNGQSPLALLGLLAWQYRMVVAAASLQSLGIPTAQIARKVGQTLNAKPTPVKKAMRIASRLGYVKAVEAFQLIFEAGYKARLGIHTFEQAAELLVIKLSRLGMNERIG